MGIAKLLYQDLPNFLSALRHLKSSSTVHSRGLTFRLTTDNWITKYRARSFNDKEPEILEWLDENLRDGDVFFDVGANVGLYSIYAALRNKKAAVYAFEPEYSNLHQLKLNIINNNLFENVIPFGIALGDQAGLSYLHIQDLTAGAALATESNDTIKKSFNKDVVWKEGIGTIYLDFLFEKFGIQPNLIKIDVDGNEYKILQGGIKIFQTTELRSVYIEMIESLPDYEPIKNFLLENGFKLQFKSSDNQVWSRL